MTLIAMTKAQTRTIQTSALALVLAACGADAVAETLRDAGQALQDAGDAVHPAVLASQQDASSPSQGQDSVGQDAAPPRARVEEVACREISPGVWAVELQTSLESVRAVWLCSDVGDCVTQNASWAKATLTVGCSVQRRIVRVVLE